MLLLPRNIYPKDHDVFCRLVKETRREQKQEWKFFRNALDKSERKSFDEMWDIPRLYVMSCSNSVQLVPLHPIVISILFHHFKELKKCISEVEQIEASRTTTTTADRTKKEEEELLATLDGYYSYNPSCK
jgi:hypothetical protein